MDGHGGPSVFDMCRIEEGGDLRCAEHRQISLHGWLLVVLADGIVRVTGGRAGIRRERTLPLVPRKRGRPRQRLRRVFFAVGPSDGR
jgi:hypothetical protein